MLETANRRIPGTQTFQISPLNTQTLPNQAWHWQSGIAVIGTLAVLGATWEFPVPEILLALALVPIAAVLAFRFPFALCLTFIVFSFFRLHEVFPQLGPLHLPAILGAGVLIVLAGMLASRRISLAWTPELKLFAVFFALATLGVTTAVGRDVAFDFWKDTFVKIAAMVFAMATLIDRPRSLVVAGRVFVMAGVLVATVALYNRNVGIGLVEGNRVTIGRDIGSMLGDPNDLALVLTFPLSFAAAAMLAPRAGWTGRLLGGLAFAIVTLAILATGSRGGLLGAVAVLGTFAAQRVRSRLILFGSGGIGIAILLTLAGLRGGGSSNGIAVDKSSMGRLNAWKAAFRMALEHPLTGVGLNNFRYNFYFYVDRAGWEGFAKAVHSAWFQVLAEGGFLGLAVFLFLVARTMRVALRSSAALARERAGAAYDPQLHTMAQAVFSGLIGFCISGTFLSQGYTWCFYILLALTVSIERQTLRLTCPSVQTIVTLSDFPSC